MILSDLPEYLPIKRAAQQRDIPLSVLEHAVNEGLVAAVLVNNKVLVSDADVAVVAAQILGADDDELVSIREAARRLAIHSGTVWQWYHLGWLKEHGRGSNRVIFVSWQQAQALENLYKKRSRRGQRLIPKNMEVRDSFRVLL